jgi:hypothetical protein
MKYIILQDQNGIQFAAFCFAPQTHEQLATAWRRDESRRVVSAGFVEFHDNRALVFGYSASLQIGPGPNDEKFLTAFYRLTVKQGAITCNIASPQVAGAASEHKSPTCHHCSGAGTHPVSSRHCPYCAGAGVLPQ